MTFDKRHIAEALLVDTQSLGHLKTNAVLMLLDGATSIKPYQRYPESGLFFANDVWRVYYHSHGNTGDPGYEHGHFHFFARLKGLDDWAHVVAMGVNNQGQPISLFTTNLWVTDGKWLYIKDALQLFEQLEQSEETELVQDWFKNLLLLYRDDIIELLFERDQALDDLFPRDRDQGFFDRSVYYLSKKQMDLNTRLFEVLADPLLASVGR